MARVTGRLSLRETLDLQDLDRQHREEAHQAGLELHRQKKRVEELQEELGASNIVLDRLRADNVALRSDNASLREENARLRNQNQPPANPA